VKRFRDDEKKLAELMLYVAGRLSDDPTAGAVKLNKILYHADFRAYLELGAPITGHAYYKRTYGPAPKRLRPVREYLVTSGAADLVQEDVGAPKPQERLVARRQADVSLFTDAELRIADAVIEEFRPLRGMELSDDSHKEPGWRAAEADGLIPYATALIARTTTDADRDRAAELAQQSGWR
jgi:hypothetical protein